MGYKVDMSTRYLFFVAVLLAVSQPAFAAPDMAKLGREAVYRTNLGRAADIQILLDQGVPANHKSEDGTPLIALAAARTDEDAPKALQVLIAAGADVNAKDAQGQTALFHAARVGSADAVKQLLEANVNSYAVDNKGDIARTIAFRAGKNDIVAQLDQFIADQAAKVNKQYEDANASLAQRYKDDLLKAEEAAKTRREAEEKAREEARLKHEEQLKKLELEREKLELEKEKLKDIKEKAAHDAEEARLKKIEDDQKKAEEDVERQMKTEAQELVKLSEAMALYSCGFQYWYYCREDGQPTELSRDEIDTAIEFNTEKIIEISQKISRLNPDPPDYADQLSDRIKMRVYDQLQAIPRKQMRKEMEVGTLSDQRRRCGEISRQWRITDYQERRAKAVRKKDDHTGLGGINKRIIEEDAPHKREAEAYDPRKPPPKIYYKPGS